MPPPCFQRPWRSISWVGAPFWAMRRAIPTRPLWPLKNSQSANPAALAIAFTRRAIWDSDSPNTFSSLATPAGRMASSAFMAAGVMATTAPWASTSVLERMTVMRPLPSSQPLHVAPGKRRRLGAAQPAIRQHGDQGHVKHSPFGGLLRRFEAVAAGPGFRSGEPDHGEHVGGEGAGLALGFRQPTPPSFQRGAYPTILAGRFVARPLMGLGDGGGGEPHGGDAGAGAGAGSQVAGDGEGLRRQGREAYVATPVGEQPPLGAVDAAGVVGEDGLQGVGHALVGGAQLRRCGRGTICGLLTTVVIGESPEAGLWVISAAETVVCLPSAG